MAPAPTIRNFSFSLAVQDGGRHLLAPDLSGCGQGDAVHDEHFLRTLVFRQALAAVLEQLGFVGSSGLVQHHRGRHFLAQHRMRHAEGDGIGHRGVRQQHFVHLAGRNVVAAADDQVLDPAGEVQVVICIQHALVAGAKPSVHKGSVVGLAVVLVSAEHARPLNDHLAAFSGGEMIALGVHDADLNAAGRPHRTRLAMLRRQRIRRHLVGSFRHPVGFDQGHAEQFLHLVHDLRRHRRAGRADEAQGSGLMFVAVGARQQKLVHGGHSRIPGHAIFVHGAPEGQRAEFGGDHHRPARNQHRQRRCHQPVNVEHRHDAQGHIVGSERVGVGDVGGGDGQVGVLQRHPLGTSGAAAGVQDQRHLLGRGRFRRVAPARLHQVDRALGVHLDRERGDTAVGGGAARLLRAMRRAEQNVRAGVSQEEKEFLVGIGGIERRGGAGDGSGQEGDQGGQAIGQNGGHTPAAVRAAHRQDIGHRQNLLPQRIVGDAEVEFRDDDGRPIAGRQLQQIQKRCGRVHRRLTPRF